VLALQKRYRAFVVTDRNVYVFQASSVSTYKVTKMLEKRPLGAARVEFRRAYLTLDGEHESLTGFYGPAKRLGLAVAEAASRPVAGSSPARPEPNVTA
jgi:hypothetical protein